MKETPVSTLMIILLTSAAVLFFELSLLRSYAYLSYYHFGFLVISLALLGFALSGVLIHLFYHHLAENIERSLDYSLSALVIAIPASLMISDMVRPDVLALNADWTVSGAFILHTLCILPPFLLGASLIALILSVYSRSGLLYGLNLFGSGMGGAAVLLVLIYISPETAPMIALIPTVTASLVHIIGGTRSAGRILIMSMAIFTGCGLALLRDAPPPDEYKAVNTARMLEKQGEAEHLDTVLLPGVRIDAYASDRFHSHLFTGLNAIGEPPPQVQLFYDGVPGGAVFLPRKSADLEFLSAVPQSLAYRIVDPETVLILGERGNSSLYIAAYLGAEDITLVRSTRAEQDLQEEMNRFAPLKPPPCVAETALPLEFLRKTDRRYTIIHLAEAEGLPSASTGMEMLAEMPILTVEGFSLAVSRLKEGGVLSITRGIRLPPRDNLRILATALEALEMNDNTDPAGHVAAVRNHLAVTTMVFGSEIEPARSAAIEDACRTLGLEIIHLPYYVPDPDRAVLHGFPSPPGIKKDWYGYAAEQLMADREKREDFYRRYPYDIRPREIDSPYFSFFPVSENGDFPDLLSAGGQSGFTEGFLSGSEAAYKVLKLSLVALYLTGLPLIILPLVSGRLRRRSGINRSAMIGRAVGTNRRLFGRSRSDRMVRKRAPARGTVCIYALCIGLAFMVLEYTLLARFSLVLGHPVLGASAVISAFLICAGLGSLTLGDEHLGRKILVSGICAALSILLLEAGWGGTMKALSLLNPRLRFCAALLLCGLPAFFMGRMFPALMKYLHAVEPALIPYVWGVNGFASVITGPLSMLLFLHTGYWAGSLIAAGLYICAAGCGQLFFSTFSSTKG